jgi:hypothetical protein
MGVAIAVGEGEERCARREEGCEGVGGGGGEVNNEYPLSSHSSLSRIRIQLVDQVRALQ